MKWFEKTYATKEAARAAIKAFGVRGEWKVVAQGNHFTTVPTYKVYGRE